MYVNRSGIRCHSKNQYLSHNPPYRKYEQVLLTKTHYMKSILIIDI